MSCRVTGFDRSGRLAFLTASATAVESDCCSIAVSDTDIRHLVKIQPQRKYYRKIKVIGRLCHTRGSSCARYIGPSITDPSSWAAVVPIANATISLKDMRFKHLSCGTEDVEVEIEAEDPWNPDQFSRVDQANLTFSISLL